MDMVARSGKLSLLRRTFANLSICRPMSDKEIAERTPQVISCNEVLREVTLYQNVGGKQMSRTFRFDKVRITGAVHKYK